jgi:predicted metal-dependent hydrolase
MGTYEVELVRKNITRCYLYVRSASGPLTVSAPPVMPLDAIERFVLSRTSWIERRRRDLGSSSVAKATSQKDHLRVDGTVMLWGEPHDALFVLDQAGIAARRARAELAASSGAKGAQIGDREAVNAAIREALRILCAQRAVQLVRQWEPVMGVSVASVHVHDTLSRWGSCNVRTHAVNFSLWLAHYPPECLEQVVVHELSHLIERSHNARFYAVMDRYLPDWKARRDLLRSLSLGQKKHG